MLSKVSSLPPAKNKPQINFSYSPLAQDEPDTNRWKVLVVDDVADVHNITRLALRKFKFKEKPLTFLNAYSAQEARTLIKAHPDTAVILLDVVMEADDAGLTLIKYIRNTLRNKWVRIILRTGQPGQAPEDELVLKYDINDYKLKTELTGQKLFLTLVTAIRSYHDLMLIEASRKELIETYANLEKEMTRRKQTKQALQISQERYHQVISSISDHTYVSQITENGHYTNLHLSPHLERLTGYSQEKFNTDFHFWATLVHPDDQSLAKAQLERLATGHDSEVEYRVFRANGDIIWVRDSARVEFDGTSKTIYGVISNITERKQVEETLKKHQSHLEELVIKRTAKLTATNQQLLQEVIERERAETRQSQLVKELESANQELKEFAYVVSHDLKAPLRAISSLAEWLSKDYTAKLDGNGQEMLKLLTGRVRRMHNLINGILQYSRAGRLKEKKTAINLSKLLVEVLDLIDPPAHIEIRVKNNLPTIHDEYTRIEQVFLNLLNNAIKYIDKPVGIIEIDCLETDTLWQFSVADNGPGIEKRYFDKIFQIFQTLASRDEIEGTGVGLALVKKFVESGGGQIWVESIMGQGTTFFFTLPKNEALFENYSAEAAPTPSDAGGGPAR